MIAAEVLKTDKRRCRFSRQHTVNGLGAGFMCLPVKYVKEPSVNVNGRKAPTPNTEVKYPSLQRKKANARRTVVSMGSATLKDLTVGIPFSSLPRCSSGKQPKLSSEPSRVRSCTGSFPFKFLDLAIGEANQDVELIRRATNTQNPAPLTLKNWES